MTILIALATIAPLVITNVNAKNLEIANKLLTCQNGMEHPSLGLKAISEFALSDLSFKLQYAITAIHGEYKPTLESDELVKLNQEELTSCKSLINSQNIFDIKETISDLPIDPYIRMDYCDSLLIHLKRSYRKGTEEEIYLQNTITRLISARTYLGRFDDVTNKKGSGMKIYSQHLDKSGGHIEERKWQYCIEMGNEL